jgi:hypothetical protein
MKLAIESIHNAEEDMQPAEQERPEYESPSQQKCPD